MAKTKTRSKNAARPEKKFGPFPGGIGIAIWRNTADTDDGPRDFRSLTISPRRYRDPQTDAWRDASSFRPQDIAVLQFALSKAQEFLLVNPLRPRDAEDSVSDVDDESIPF